MTGEKGPLGLLSRPLRSKVFRKIQAQDTISDDVFQDIIWALQDIAIIRALANFKDDPRVPPLIYKYFNLLLCDLLMNDLPRHGMKTEDVNEVKNLIEKARVSPIDSVDFDSNLAGADGAFCRLSTEYSEKYYESKCPK